MALALLSSFLNLGSESWRAGSMFGHQLPSHVRAGRVRTWRTTDTVSSGLCFALAGSRSEAGMPGEPGMEPQLCHLAPVPWVSSSIGDPSTFPSRKYNFEIHGASRLTAA